MKLKFESVS